MDLAFLIVFGILVPFNAVAAGLAFRKWRRGVQGPKSFILQTTLAVVCALIALQLGDRLFRQTCARAYVDNVVQQLQYGKAPDVSEEMPDDMRLQVEALREYDFGPNYGIEAYPGLNHRAFVSIVAANGETFLFGVQDMRPGTKLWLTRPVYKVYLMVRQNATAG